MSRPNVARISLFDGKAAMCLSILGLLYNVTVDCYYFSIRHELYECCMTIFPCCGVVLPFSLLGGYKITPKGTNDHRDSWWEAEGGQMARTSGSLCVVTLTCGRREEKPAPLPIWGSKVL